MRFKRKCPSCCQSDKVIERCLHCYKLCCNVCSINGICIDCYVKLDLPMIERYYKEKYEVGI